MDHIINAKQLRSSLPEIVKKVRRGQRFMVLYRSKPAFRLLPIDGIEPVEQTSLEDDPLYHIKPVGCATDGLSADDHDLILYGSHIP